MNQHVIDGTVLRRLNLSCELGQALAASYTDTGDQQTAQLTMVGAYERATIPDQLTLQIDGMQWVLDVDHDSVEERHDAEGVTHTLRLHNRAATRVQGEPLPELVRWHVKPDLSKPDVVRMEARQLVRSVVDAAFAAVGCSFEVLGDDPMEGLSWEAQARDYQTEGKTAASVFADAYGKFGRLVIRGTRAVFIPHGMALRQAELPACHVLASSLLRSWAHIPTRVLGSAPEPHVPADDVPPQVPPSDDDGAADVKTLTSTERDEERATVMTTVVAIRTDTGAILEKVSVTVGDIYRPDGTVALYGVFLEGEMSSYSYASDNPRMLIKERTRRVSVAYDEISADSFLSFGGMYYSGRWRAGTVLSDEQTVTVQRWYGAADGVLEGYLKSKTTAERRLVSAEQKGADLSPTDRGELAGREYATRTYHEQYYSVDGVFWSRMYSEGGGGHLPVRDADTGEPVRLIQRNTTDKSGLEVGVTPPRVERAAVYEAQAQSPERTERRVEPIRAALALDEGRGSTVSSSYGMVTTRHSLLKLLRLETAGLGKREERTLELVSVPQLAAGDGIDTGEVVTEYRWGINNGRVSASVSLLRQHAAVIREVRHPEEPPLAVLGRSNDDE